MGRLRQRREYLWGIERKGSSISLSVVSGEVSVALITDTTSTCALMEKEELIAKGAFNENAEKIDEEVKESKAVASPPRKKFIENKYKCNVKSCGKVFNTESSFSAHVKKHNEKKGRRNEQGQSQNELVNEGEASEPMEEQ